LRAGASQEGAGRRGNERTVRRADKAMER
jgi:hypothetical protein